MGLVFFVRWDSTGNTKRDERESAPFSLHPNMLQICVSTSLAVGPRRRSTQAGLVLSSQKRVPSSKYPRVAFRRSFAEVRDGDGPELLCFDYFDFGRCTFWSFAFGGLSWYFRYVLGRGLEGHCRKSHKSRETSHSDCSFGHCKGSDPSPSIWAQPCVRPDRHSTSRVNLTPHVRRDDTRPEEEDRRSQVRLLDGLMTSSGSLCPTSTEV